MQAMQLNAPFKEVFRSLFHETHFEFMEKKFLNNPKWIVSLTRKYLNGKNEKIQYVYNSIEKASDEFEMLLEYAHDENW